MPVTDQIRNKLSEMPHKPGVYLMKDRFGTVIYVGKARDLRKRVSQYFHPSRRLGWDLKFNALVEAIHDLDVHVVRSEAESVLLEGKLIKEFQQGYKHCLYGHLKFCTAPCIGNVTREQYIEQVIAACNFLDGQCEEMQAQLEVEMKKAAAAQDYEKAASYRDAMADLRKTTQKTN